MSKNTALTWLDCDNNQLTSLDVSGCTALTSLICENNQLTSLDVSKNTALTSLSCDNNQLTLLDVSGCTALTSLSCENNLLTLLDVSGCTALTSLSCDNNQLTLLDVSGCTALTNLRCYNNQLTSLDVSGCTALTNLNCYNNQLTSLDVSGYTALIYLNCYNNQLTSLDVSGCTALIYLNCENNLLTLLDVSGCTALRDLNCYNNQLTSLDLSNQANLVEREFDQSMTLKAVRLTGGQIGLDIIADGIDAARFTEMKADGTATTAVVSGHYLVIADNTDDCPNEVTYQFNTNYPISESLMGVQITIDKSNLEKLLLLDNDSGEEYNNPLRIADYVGETIDAIIDGRKLLINGNWNTMCLPFGINVGDYDGWTVKEFVGSSYTATTKTLTLDFAEGTEIEAGKPYLVKVSNQSGEDFIDNLSFDGVTISDSPAAVIETECVDFVGSYSTFNIVEKDRTLLYMGGDSKLYYPSVAMKIGAFRGYFRLKNGLSAGDLNNNGAKEIVLNFGGGDVTGVNLIDADSANDSWYTIDGRKLSGKPTAKGIYIYKGKKVIK